MSDQQYDFGLVGLGVMGRNFILNVADHDFSAYGLDTSDEMLSRLRSEGEGKSVDGTTQVTEFAAKLSSPRKIMLLVPAGKIVDIVIADLLPHLDEGDIIIDGGNSYFPDTDRRFTELAEKGIHFFGTGVSGGAEGARLGPSIMVGGNATHYEHVRPIFEAVSAKVGDDACVAHVGNGSSGHYVKMVHNGIEYALMQLIAEAYDMMKYGLGMTNLGISEKFAEWNEGRLQSFLIEITSEIFLKPDELTNKDLIDVISDKAKQKGTGKWISQNAMDLGTPIPAIDASVSMRAISSFKEERAKAAELYPKSQSDPTMITIEELEDAVYFGFIITFAQGMKQLAEASVKYEYGLNLENIAKIWRGGCIIRARLLETITDAYGDNSELTHLLFHDKIVTDVNDLWSSVNKVVDVALNAGISVAGLSASANYFNAFRSERLPLNLIQAQRDYFGSHTYERTDRDGHFHTEW
ncbi:MAG: NADP-dependent phosphogluconate dehydrogenase [Roseivirga sp.]|nr:NADP-dependent phosphogluconate dehydrogenase [Roseivirga sp.]